MERCLLEVVKAAPLVTPVMRRQGTGSIVDVGTCARFEPHERGRQSSGPGFLAPHPWAAVPTAIPLACCGRADEVREPLAFLASDKAGWRRRTEHPHRRRHRAPGVTRRCWLPGAGQAARPAHSVACRAGIGAAADAAGTAGVQGETSFERRQTPSRDSCH